MPRRSQHRASGGQDAQSERPARWHRLTPSFNGGERVLGVLVVSGWGEWEIGRPNGPPSPPLAPGGFYASFAPGRRSTQRTVSRKWWKESARASQEASITFSLTPTVPQTRSPSVLSIETRTFAAVPSWALITRTL